MFCQSAQLLKINGKDLVRNNVSLHWAPGHIGVERNEKIDELARKGASTPR